MSPYLSSQQAFIKSSKIQVAIKGFGKHESDSVGPCSSLSGSSRMEMKEGLS